MQKRTEKTMERYLKPTYTIEATHERIVEKAAEVTRNCSTDVEKAKAIFYFVRDGIAYNAYMASVFIEDFRASQVLEWGKGYCVQKAVLLAALGRASGIPSRLVFAKIRNHKLPPRFFEWFGSDVFPRHGYNQLFLEGGWVSVAAPFDRNLCEQNGLPTVEFDGVQDAVLPERGLEGEPYIAYLEKFPPTDDLPFDWIRKRLIRVLGPDKRALTVKESIPGARNNQHDRTEL
ncbi:MAG: transglutaminase-like domain-containing protein [Desulfatiglandales bacterium]